MTSPLHLPFHDLKPRNWQPDEPPCLDGVDAIQLDGEFDGLNWHSGAKPCGWAVSWRDGNRLHSRYLPHSHRGGGNLPKERVQEWLQREVRGKRVSNHSTKIDIHMARVDGTDLEAQGCTFHDVSHSAALLDDFRVRFNLHELAQDELKAGKLDPGVPKDQIAFAPGWQIAPYAKRDVELVARLEDVFRPRLAAEGLEAVQALEDAVIPTVVEMEKNGVPYSQETLDAWLARLAQIETDYLWELRRSFGFAVDPSDKASIKKVFALLGIAPGRKIREGSKDPDKNGQPYDSYATEFVEAAAEVHPRLQPLRKLMLLRTMRSKVFIPLHAEGINGLYTPTYHQLRSVTDDGDPRGVVSGRFSAPLIHQLTGENKYTKKYGTFGDRNETFWSRELFREVDGYWFCADAKQIQYRVMCHASQSERLLGMYRDDPWTNFHGMVGGWVRPMMPSITDTEVKILNFLTIFGGGVAATANLLKCPTEQAQGFRDHYFAAFPEAQQTIDKVKNVAEYRGYVRSVLGRRSRHPHGTWTDKRGQQRRGRLRTHKGLNEVCQMNEADVMKTKMVILHRERKRLGLTPRITLHDEYGGRLADKTVAPQIIDLLNEQSIPFSVPLLWSGGVPEGVQSWANAK
jgi:DNA polymerase-1